MLKNAAAGIGALLLSTFVGLLAGIATYALTPACQGQLACSYGHLSTSLLIGIGAAIASVIALFALMKRRSSGAGDGVDATGHD